MNTLAPGVRSGDTVSYTLTVTNLGKTHGVQPEDVSVELVLDPGVKVVRAMGNGYQGVQRHPLSGRDVAVWKVPTITARRTAKLHAGCYRSKGGPGASHDCPAGSLEPDVGSPRSRGSLESPLGETDHARIPQHGQGCAQAPCGRPRWRFSRIRRHCRPRPSSRIENLRAPAASRVLCFADRVAEACKSETSSLKSDQTSGLRLQICRSARWSVGTHWGACRRSFYVPSFRPPWRSLS